MSPSATLKPDAENSNDGFDPQPIPGAQITDISGKSVIRLGYNLKL
jgi:hypothetical protein